MKSSLKTILASLALAALCATQAQAAVVDDVEAVRIATPKELIISPSIKASERKALLAPVDAFYGFWNNGSLALLDKALSSGFIDHTLPKGRPQGASGPAAAARGFLGAVPDLQVFVVQRLVVGDRVVSHLQFKGHFTGALMGEQGTGQPIDFIATDILRVRDGKITDNWHLEDNLTLLQQIGKIPASP